MKSIRQALKHRYFLDTVAEWHALVQGFSEVLCPWPPRYEVLSQKLAKEINDEHHYYMFGRVLGVLAWLAIAKIIQEVFF